MQRPYPDWVYNNFERYVGRIGHEAKELYAHFPNIGIYREGDTMYLEGPVLTMSGNAYIVRVVYPSDYPYGRPSGYIRDSDVISYCKVHGGHKYHNYGESPPHGLNLCVMGPPKAGVNKGWTINQTGITILEHCILWLHAYEYKRATGVWPLPE